MKFQDNFILISKAALLEDVIVPERGSSRNLDDT
jgi:hypothetical protein